MKLRRRIRKLTGGWLGGLILFSAVTYAGFIVSAKMPVDTDYDLSFDFITQRKLEYFAKSENESSSPLMDVSELNAKVKLGNQVIPIKISSMPEPFSDVDRQMLSFFVTNEEDTDPYLLLSPTRYSTNYVDVTTKLSESVLKTKISPQIINLKTNGINRHPYFKIDLPANEEFESLPLADAFKDKNFKDLAPKWAKVISESATISKEQWASDILVYFQRDEVGKVRVSHFLPSSLREFYE